MEGPSVSTGKPASKAGHRGDGDLRGKVTYLPDIHRLLPQSPDAEQGVLCSFLLNPREVGGLCVEKGVTAECFHIPAHSGIFAVLLELWNAAKPIDFITLTQVLRDRGLLDQVGGAPFITELFTFIPTAANAAYYIEILQEKWTLRQVITTCTEYAARSYDEQDNVPTLLDEVEQQINKIARERFQTKSLSMKDQVMEAIESIEKLYERRGSITGLPTGYSELDKMTDGLHGAEMFVIAARPSMGKCLAHDSEILLGDGSVTSIGKICERRKAELLTMGNDFRLRSTVPSDYIDDGVKPVFRVTTKLGRAVETTLTHPFLTITGWKPLGELKPGDRVAVPRRLDIFGNDTLPDAEVLILGYLLGDGGLTNRCPRFTNANPLLCTDFEQAVLAMGGLTVRSNDSAGGRAMSLSVSSDRPSQKIAREDFARRLAEALKKSGRPDRQLALTLGVAPSCFHAWKRGRAVPVQEAFAKLCDLLAVSPSDLAPLGYSSIARNHPNALTLRLKSWGIMGCGAKEKFIPPIVFSLRRAQIALFLNRLFATDGWASTFASGQAQIGYASVSERMARQVQHLLLRFGIIASLRQRQVLYAGSRRPAWQLEITDAEAIRTFTAEIGIFGKEAAILRVSEALATRRRYQTNRDTIPMEAWALVAEAKGADSWAGLARAAGFACTSNIHAGKRALSRARLRALASALDLPKLRHLAESDIYWDEIVSIEYAGEKQVYDLTIPETHNFVANDICVHNTALAMNIAENVAVDHKMPVAIFSLEMSSQQLVQRLLCSRARVNLQRVRDGFLSERDFPNLTSAASKLAESKIFIDDTAGLSILELRAKARRLKTQHDIQLIVIDYLQLLRSTSRRAQDNRQLEIAEISSGVKALAKELAIPIIVLAQLNRNPENRSGESKGRPRLSDLRESGSIEQDADIVALLVREEYYADSDEEKQEAEGKATLIIAKQRNGPVGDVPLTFLKEFTRFEDRARSEAEPQ